MANIGATANRMVLVDSEGNEVMMGSPASLTARGTLDANGAASVVFAPPFDLEPAVGVLSVGAFGAKQAVPNFDVTFTKDTGGKTTGCTLYGQRAKPLPPAAAVPLIGTLSAALGGYQPYEPAAGAGFCLFAVKTLV